MWLLMIYVIGFSVIFIGHALYFQNVTFELALLRSAVWPIWIVTGWPQGVQLTTIPFEGYD